MTPSAEDYRQLADAVLRVLTGGHAEARAYYYRECDRIGEALDQLQSVYPDHDGPMDDEARELADAGELLGRYYADLATFALTGERPLPSDRLRSPG